MNFKVGEIYKDHSGNEYKFIAHVPEASIWARAVFVRMCHMDIIVRYTSGAVYSDTNNTLDILPPEKKTIKLYPALFKNGHGSWACSDSLYDECPEYAIRLLTEWPPVIVEVES